MNRFSGWALLSLVLLVAGAGRPARAQLYETTYRPPEVRYWQQESEHFRIIYQQGLEREAAEAAAILERTLPLTRDLVGLRRALKLPLVLNRFNDRSNGYVTPLPFRQEVEAPPIRGNILSPRSPSWLATVLPHELTHAVHAQSGTGVGFGWALRPFAPDLSRAVNFAAPAGFSEGVAVYLESTLWPGSGRLNHSLFEMQFRAAMLSDRPWSLVQLLEPPVYTRPFDRHYYGGYLFEYMAGQGRLGFFERARDTFYRFPLLGFGLPFRLATGQSARGLGRDLRRHFRAAFEAARDALGPLTEPHVVSSAPGLLHRRPRWTPDGDLLVYASGYDVRPGFYRIDPRTGRRTAVSHQRITEDYFFSFEPDSSAILFARYVVDPLVSIRATSELFRLDLATGETRRLTDGGRLAVPVPAPEGSVWALRVDRPFPDWVRWRPGGPAEPAAAVERATFISLAPSPRTGEVAVVLNGGGRQGLFLAEPAAGGPARLVPLVLFDEGSVFDAAWSADARYLLFSADPGGVSNVFAYDVERRAVLKLTNVPFGALEPTLSPDGRTLAFVHYRHERFDLATIPFEPERAETVPPSVARFEGAADGEGLVPDPPAAVPMSEPRPYGALAHLAPRLVSPTLRYDRAPDQPGVDLGLGLGVAVQGADPLDTWSYGAEVYHQHEALWGSLYVSSSAFVLRPTLELYRRASAVLAGRPGQVPDVVRVGRDERGVALGLSLPVVLSSNVYSTTLAVALRGEYRDDRLFDRSGDVLAHLRERLTLRPSAALAYRVQANVRDIVPNSGLRLSVQSGVDVWTRHAGRERWSLARLDAFVPLLASVNGGFRASGALLVQNEAALLDVDTFVPRGFEGRRLGSGTFARYGAEVVQPFWFVDDGLLFPPLYVEAVYAYGFGERLDAVAASSGAAMTSLGGGLGLQVRLFHLLDVDLRLGLAYRVEDRRWTRVYR